MSDWKEEIREIIAEYMEIDPSEIEDDTPFKDLGMDSFTTLEIMLEIENKYQISIDEELIPQMTILNATIEVIDEVLKKEEL